MKNFTLSLVAFFWMCTASAHQKPEDPKKDDINTRIEQHLNNAEISINRLDLEEAHEELRVALELARSKNHQRYVAQASGLLAQMYFVRHEYKEATTELERALSIQKNLDDKSGLAYSYIMYAKILNGQRNSDLAAQYLDLAEEIYREQADTDNLGVVELNRGVVALNTEQDYPKAEQSFKRAEQLLSNSNLYERSRLHYYKAKLNMFLEDYDRALEEAQRGLRLSGGNNYRSMEMSMAGLISHIHKINRDYEQALAYLEMSNNLRDSIYNVNREALASEANARYGVDSMRNTLNEYRRQNEEQERSLKVNKLTTILSVALITILSLLTLSLYKNNNLRARANDLLQKKNSELVTAKENAEKASMAKAQFLSTITHELRTPLYAVTGLTHLLLEESPTENQKEHLNSLKFSGEYLLSLINNILDLNKLEAKKVEMLETSFNLKKRVSDVLIALKNSAEDKKTKLHLEFENAVPQKLKGDPLKISQILINLIGNSIKFTENGDIWVRVKMLSQNGNNVMLRFEIEDNGEGISKEKQKAIFENFTQGSMQINRKFGGTGLGLSIVKNLLNLMESEIHLESELGEGSLFYFDLQFQALEPAPAVAATGTTKEEPRQLSNDIMHHKRILIVEDNKINQMITRKILEKHKVICDVADNGTIAVEKVRNGDFDLILMDIHMPGISGIEATIEIRKFDPAIPIIALTAVTLDENLDEFYLNGFNDIIPKPYKTEEFFLKINKYLSQEKATV